jgi:hypothetical protein
VGWSRSESARSGESRKARISSRRRVCIEGSVASENSSQVKFEAVVSCPINPY